MKTNSFIYGMLFSCAVLAVYSFTTKKSALMPAVPNTTISVEEARHHRALFLENNDQISSDITFSYEELSSFMEYLEFQKEAGEDIESVRVYLSEYEDGTKTGFVVPIKDDKSPNYNVPALNKGQNGWPPNDY